MVSFLKKISLPKMTTLVWKHFRTNLSLSFLMLLILCFGLIIPCTVLYYTHFTNTISQEQNVLNNNVKNVDAQLSSLETLLISMVSYSKSNLLALENELKSDDYIEVGILRQDLTSLCANNNLLMDVFLLFENSQTVITATGAYSTLANINGVERFLNSYHIDDTIVGYFRKPELLGGKIRFFPSCSMMIPGNTAVRPAGFVYAKKIEMLRNVYAFWVIDQEALASIFQYQPGFLSLYGYNGEAIFSMSQGSGLSKYNLQSPRFSRIHGELILDNKMIQDMTISALSMIAVYLLILLLISFILATIHAYRQAVPVQKLVDCLQNYGYQQDDKQGLFGYFMNTMENMHRQQQITLSETNQLRNRLEQSIVERYLLIPSNQILEDKVPALQWFPQRFIVAYATLILHEIHENPEQEQLLEFPLSVIASRMSQTVDAISIPIDFSSFVLIIAVESEEDQHLYRLRQAYTETVNTTHIPLTMVVSTIHNGLLSLNNAYEQCRSFGHQSSFETGFYQIKHEEISQIDDESMDNNIQLQQAILLGDDKKAIKMIHKMLTSYDVYTNLEQRYYNIRMSLLQIMQTFPLDNISLPSYSPQMSPESLFNQLARFTEALSHKVTEHNLSDYQDESILKKKAIEQKVMSYIQDHFACDKLSIQMICEECGIREYVLSSICKNATGMNVSSYIQQLRLDKAAAMLRNTDEKVTQILLECGYNTSNAFYKAFKNFYKKTPSEYRLFYRDKS